MSIVTRSRAMGLLAMIGVAVLVVAACGGGDEATATPRPAAPTATPTSVGAPAQATATPRPAAPAQATATTPAGQPAATATRPAATAGPQATPVPSATPTPVAPGFKPPDFPNAKYGGQLKRRTMQDPPSFNALVERTVNAQDAMQPTFDQLAQFNPYNQTELVPQLAESWKVSTDGLTWTFNLRKGIKFHNGNAFTSADAKWTIETALNPPRGVAPSLQAYIASIDKVNTPDDSTIEIKMKEADASLLEGLGWGLMVMLDKESIDKDGFERLNKWPTVGTGPFIGKEGSYVRGVSTEIFRNQDYWVKGRPFLDGMKFFIIPDAATAFAAFLTGQINFGSTANLSDGKEAQSRLGARLYIEKGASTTWWGVPMNMTKKPFDDIRVREAIALGVDKQAVIDLVVQGLGAIGGAFPPGAGWGLTQEELEKEIPGYGKDRKANIARAKKLLADAGFPNGLKTRLWARPDYRDTDIAIGGTLADIGVDAPVEIVDLAKWQGDVNNTSQGLPTVWEIAPTGRRTRVTDPNAVWREFYLPGAFNNYSAVNDKQTVDLFNAQKGEVDPAKRKQKVKDLERRTQLTFSWVVLYYSVAQYVRYSNIKNHTYFAQYNGNLQLRDVWIE